MRILSILFLVTLLAKPSYASEWVQAKDEDAVIAQVKNLVQVRQFITMYPQAEFGGIGHRSGVFTAETEQEVKETLYASFTAGLYGRYLLTMAMPCKLAEDRVHLATVGNATFDLQEVESVTIQPVYNLPGGVAHIRYSPFSRSFDYGQFETLRMHGGDFEAIGITLRKEAPVDHFERAWKSQEPQSDHALQPTGAGR